MVCVCVCGENMCEKENHKRKQEIQEEESWLPLWMEIVVV